MNVAIVSCFGGASNRVEFLHDIFVLREDNVRVYTSSFSHFEKCERVEQKKDFIYIKTKEYHKNLSLQRLYSHRKFAKDVFRRLQNQKIDILWVLIPPNSLTVIAGKLKKKYPNMRLIIDVIDMWPESLPVDRMQQSFPLQKWRKLRDDYLYVADHIVTECEFYQSRLGMIDSNKISVIHLAREITAPIAHPNPPDDTIALCYLGSINNIIDIEEIERIICKLGQIKPVQLHIIGDGESRKELIEKAKMAGADVSYHGVIYETEEKQRVFDTCHFGLNIMKDTVFVGLTIKSVDYLEGGLPLINNIKGDTWGFVERDHIGINVDNLENIEHEDWFQLRVNARTCFEKTMGKDTFYERVEDVIQQCT